MGGFFYFIFFLKKGEKGVEGGFYERGGKRRGRGGNV